ncbi:protein of unknown function (DUF3331) [Burkholderia sp. Ch1-1]|uniref:DUF3331 domain-containing protein n=1 Tax=Paraburkholderia dioscoreae TaxID=2604047 RepID=A0A5Q4ZKP0_9BURK|nr:MULTISPECIES: DUF3331 domain-containing protein [Paraburkholderia]EIF33933.1 protein of unknown function (DUF3331) [Burkholderia sp. Ch1-1]MDR8396211.1 DUF3331 domain-containing protein [Paraburkholderia sp. USG1]VVD32841.1 conserved protein of unknown function [Paraburkholderia dioscoreae]
MLANANIIDPWMQTIGLLSAPAGGPKGRDSWLNGGNGARHVYGTSLHTVTVSLIDRPSPTTATISWRDSTRCCYGDQVWCASRAYTEGVCAMSRQPIRRGDAVYKPRACGRAPRNADAMILASVLDDGCG